MPQISVLMPVRDGAKWIGASIDSVLAQSFDDFELLIVDDGSADDTPRIILDYASRDPRILVTTLPAGGLVIALNRGIALARGSFLARLDADDIAEPSRFAEQIAEMTRNPGLALLGSWVIEIDETGHRSGVRRPKADAEMLRRELHLGNPMIHSTVMLRTAMAREAGGYRAAFAAAEDFDLWLRLSERGDLANLERELVRYRVHAASVSGRKAMLQSFSTRLAQRSAILRRAGLADPAATMAAPFDLWSDPPHPYAEEVALYRLLAWAEPQTIPPTFRNVAPDFKRLRTLQLTRRERSFAQRAILRYLAAFPAHPRAALWMQIVALRPVRAMALLRRQMFDPTHSACEH